MKFGFTFASALTLIICFVLAGCGGSSDSAKSSPAVFDFKSANRLRALPGHTENVAVTLSGSKKCSGTGSITYSPAMRTQLNVSPAQQVPALSYDTTHQWGWNDCPGIMNTISSTTYINSDDFAVLGYRSDSLYGIFFVPPTYPDQLKVGDTGSLGYMNIFTDATETVPSGYAHSLFSVTAGTNSNSATFSESFVIYDGSGALYQTIVTISRFDSRGKFTFLSEEIKYPQTGVILTFTAK